MKLFYSLLLIFSILGNPLIINAEEIVLAGGCFWCLEHDLEYLDGVESVESGYSGGTLINPTYENHNTHQEVVIVKYDPIIINSEKILRLYLRNIDPLDGDGQFCDRGDSYRPVIFFSNQDEEKTAQNSLSYASKEIKVPIEEFNVEIKPRSKFWKAEDYHQDFANNNELKYKFYRYACGRDKRLDQVWGQKARTSDLWSN